VRFRPVITFKEIELEMRLFRNAALTLAIALLAVPSFAQSKDVLHQIDSDLIHAREFEKQPWMDEKGVMRSGGMCATRHYSNEEINILETAHNEGLMTGRIGINYNAPAAIKVKFHIITDGSKGNVSTAVINNTMAKLNSIFAGGEGGVNTGISFTLEGVQTYNNRAWYAAKPGSRAEAEMKQTISGTAGNSSLNRLNIYTNSPGTYMGGTLLGWATFPWELASNPLMDGVVMNNIALNHGGSTSYNAGDVVAHEVGHWLGLYHTFQGGCTGSTSYDGTPGQGDTVADTAPEASSASGCPTGRDSCTTLAGLDPIDNYMDYSSNSCQVRFTSGQNGRLVAKSGLRSGL
jgi:hypothetical protein